MHVTLQGLYCHQHLKQHLGLAIQDSELPGTRKGLFTTKDIPKGAVIAAYTGNVIVEHDPNFQNTYALQIKDRPPTYIDASKSNTAPGRYAKDAHGRDNNSELLYNTKTKDAFLRAIRDIHAGEEILTSYGDEYWDTPSIPNIKKMRKKNGHFVREQNRPVLQPRVYAHRQVADQNSKMVILPRPVDRRPVSPEEQRFGEQYDDDEQQQNDHFAQPKPKPKKKAIEKENNVADVVKWDNSPDLPEWKPPRKTTVLHKSKVPQTLQAGLLGLQFKRLVKSYNLAQRRLEVIQLLFRDPKLAAMMKVAVPKRAVLDLSTPEEWVAEFPDLAPTRYQRYLETAMIKEEKALVAYLKKPAAAVAKVVDAMVLKRKT